MSKKTTISKFPEQLLVVVTFLLFLITLVNIFVSTRKTDDGKTSKELSTEVDCTPLSARQSSTTVVLRVDDVQAHAWRDTTIRMISDAESRGIPLTLGVIPIGFSGDSVLVDFLKKRWCRHEFALHGWNHSAGEDGKHPEFAALSKNEAKDRITPGLEMLRLVTRDPIVTWIPPLNVQSDGTKEALTELGFKYLSLEGKRTFDYDAATFSYLNYSLVSPEKVVADCKIAFKSDSKCIIMLHPQDFADENNHDEELYSKYYTALLDGLQKEGYTFARMKDLPLE